MALPLLLATTNRAKAERLRRFCAGLDVDLIDGTATEPSIQEDGASHLANAVRKAVGWSRQRGQAALASDGGMAIPALGQDWTSLVTRRATGGDVSDEEHAVRLLRRMRDLAGEAREAYWTEAVAIARDGVVVGAWETSGLRGRVAEEFLPPAGGTGGFWMSGLWTSRISGRRHWQLSKDELAAEKDPWDILAPLVRDMLGRLGG